MVSCPMVSNPNKISSIIEIGNLVRVSLKEEYLDEPAQDYFYLGIVVNIYSDGTVEIYDPRDVDGMLFGREGFVCFSDLEVWKMEIC